MKYAIRLIFSLCFLWGVSCSNRHKKFLPEATDVAIISGADGPTNIKVSSMQTSRKQSSLKELGTQLTLQMKQLVNNREYLNFCNHSKDVNKMVADIA